MEVYGDYLNLILDINLKSNAEYSNDSKLVKALKSMDMPVCEDVGLVKTLTQRETKAENKKAEDQVYKTRLTILKNKLEDDPELFKEKSLRFIVDNFYRNVLGHKGIIKKTDIYEWHKVLTKKHSEPK